MGDPDSTGAGPAVAIRPGVLLTVVGFAGGATMVVELGAVRLLAPWFGASSSVWTNVIGVVLAALAVGYTLGARLASGPRPLASLRSVLLAGAVLAVTLPHFTPLVAGAFMPDGVALAGASRLLVWGSLASALILFLPIAACLGCACPLAVESLQRERGDAAGHAGGHVLASSTLGSLAGTFGTTHLFVPVLGTTLTFLGAGAVLLLCGLLVRPEASGRRKLQLGLFIVAFGLCFFSGWPRSGAGARGASGPQERLLEAAESPYQSLRVVERGEGSGRIRMLQVNESLDSFQSVWTPEVGLLPAGYYYNHFALPYGWARRELGRAQDRWDVFIVGLGAGSAIRVLEGVMGAETQLGVTGVELDPSVVELAEAHFELDRSGPGRTIVGGLDGRPALGLDDRVYDQVIVDAYANNMEVPPHLASVEAFEVARERLRDGGWLTVNVGGFGVDDPVVEGIASAIAKAFDGPVTIFRVPFSRNLSLHARRGAEVPEPGTRAFGSLGTPLAGGLDRLLPALQLPGAWRQVTGGSEGPFLQDQRSNMEALQARSIAAAEQRLLALDRRAGAPAKAVAPAASPEDQDLIEASRALANRGDLVGAAEAAREVRDPVAAGYLEAYLTWSGGDPQGALEGAEEVVGRHGADPALLSLVVDLALVVGAVELAGARLEDLERVPEGLRGPSVDPGVLERLATQVQASAARKAVASGALWRAKMVTGGALLLLGAALLGLWRFARTPGVTASAA
jgi:spermidine synthase